MDNHVTDTIDGVRTVLLSRPAKRNALTVAMYDTLTTTLRDAASTPLVRVVLLTGGPDCFTAGNGPTLLLHCDLAYATPGATFRLRFVAPGLCPEAAASLLLPLRPAPTW